MDLELFKKLLSFDSTSGKEREVALWLYETLEAPSREIMEVGDGSVNLFFKWGDPKVVFCSHMDTVPPYIGPEFTDTEVKGRGSCDAKGQIISMYFACKQLESDGKSDFGLLLLSGEETGSWGAKAFAKTPFHAPYLIVGEPTSNKMVSAAKGTLSYELTFSGKPFHSGYPEHGASAVDAFVTFYDKLKETDFGEDPDLGGTSWNIGRLHSDNPQNILSGKLSCRLYFRTTFVSHAKVQEWMGNLIGNPAVKAMGGDVPARYLTLDGFPCAPVAFGSDAPHLTNFEKKAICGPGSILTAHRPDEMVYIKDLETAVSQYVKMFELL